MTLLIDFLLGSGDGTTGLPQTDPNASLSGRVSSTEIQEVQSTITAASVAAPRSVFTDSTQATGAGIPPQPGSGDSRAPTANSGDYDAASDLIHWWRMTFDPTDDSGGGDRGVDYGSSPLDLSGFYNTLPSGSQIIASPQNAPDNMYVQRSSFPISSSFRGGLRTNQDWGTGVDEITVAAWVYPESLTADGISGSGTIFVLKDNIGSSSMNGQNFLHIGIADENDLNPGRILFLFRNSANTLEGRFLSNSTVSLTTWVHIAVRFRLSTQEADIFIDGVKEASYVASTFPAGMTRDESALNMDAGFGSVRSGDYRRFRGNIHSIGMWDSYLSDDAIAELATIGDGPEQPAPPVVDHLGKWLVFYSGTNTNEAREIIGWDDSTGEFTVDGDLPADVVATDPYRLFAPNGYFSAVSFDQSVRRAQKVRLGFISNATGLGVSNYRFWVVPVDPGPLVCEIAHGRSTGLTVTGVADEEDDPNLGDAGFFVQGALGKERFGRPDSAPEAEFTSPLAVTALPVGASWPIFIRLSFRTGEPVPLAHRSVFQVFAGDSTGTPIGSFLVVVDVLGADEEMILGPDRALRLKAGARVQALIRDRATGVPVPGKTISISQTAGPGTLGAQSAEVSDDSGNPVRATYLSPTDEADVGATVTFRVEVN